MLTERWGQDAQAYTSRRSGKPTNAVRNLLLHDFDSLSTQELIGDSSPCCDNLRIVQYNSLRLRLWKRVDLKVEDQIDWFRNGLYDSKVIYKVFKLQRKLMNDAATSGPPTFAKFKKELLAWYDVKTAIQNQERDYQEEAVQCTFLSNPQFVRVPQAYNRRPTKDFGSNQRLEKSVSDIFDDHTSEYLKKKTRSNLGSL